MSVAMAILCGLTACFEIVSAGILVYAIATSKVSSKKIIKAVLIGTVLYIILSAIPVLGTVLALVVFTIIFCILGSQTGHKFNVAGFVSLIAYLISLFILPVISNKNEDQLLAFEKSGIDTSKIKAVKKMTYTVSNNGTDIKEIVFYLIQVDSKWMVDVTAVGVIL